MPSQQTQHQDLAAGKWLSLSLAEQLGNIGSDFERALRWKEKKQEKLFQSASNRTMELLDLTLADSRWHNHRLQELTRLRDEVSHTLFSQKENSNNTKGLQKYFLAMASLARGNK